MAKPTESSSPNGRISQDMRTGRRQWPSSTRVSHAEPDVEACLRHREAEQQVKCPIGLGIATFGLQPGVLRTKGEVRIRISVGCAGTFSHLVRSAFPFLAPMAWHCLALRALWNLAAGGLGNRLERERRCFEVVLMVMGSRMMLDCTLSLRLDLDEFEICWYYPPERLL